MQVTETLSDGLKRELKVVIPADDIAGRLDTYLEDLKSKVRIKGFRPGKVPTAHLKRLYGRQAMAEIVSTMLNETTTKVVDERKERPALQPEINLSDEDAEKVLAGEIDLSYTMSYEVLPSFEIGAFDDIEIERPIVEISDEGVMEQVEQIAESNRSFSPKEGKTVKAENGDRVTMSYVGKIDGEPFDGGADENGQLVLGSGRFIPGFEEQLVGVKKGDETVVTVKFPDDYQADFLAGKEATFDVTVKDIEAPGELVVDDEFAKGLGLESLDKLKEIVRGQIESQFGQATRTKVKRQLLDKLDERYDFPLPEKLVENEFDNIWRQVQADMERAGKSFEDEGADEEATRADYMKIAQRRVRLGLVLSEIGESNEIQVSDEELQRAMYEQVRQYPGQEQQVFEYFQKNPAALAGLRAPIYEDKVVDYLLELAKVTDKVVTKEDLLKSDEEEDEAAEA
ncbi:trigger factor [Breoghania sp.]|uniref:trigger factor n=1 Tax=Breoghania sp. TaxID=2065378 RepID=UPI0029CA7C32|nr:trigger factor [Breoghania sp.]